MTQSFMVTDWRNHQVDMVLGGERESDTWTETEREEQRRHVAGRECDGDMRIMRCRAQKECHWDSARPWWGIGRGGGVVVMGAGLSALPHQGLV